MTLSRSSALAKSQIQVMLSAIRDQQALSRNLLRSEPGMFLGDLIFGLTVYTSRYPRIALYVHVEGMSYGQFLIILGFLIPPVAFVGRLERWELFVIWFSLAHLALTNCPDILGYESDE